MSQFTDEETEVHGGQLTYLDCSTQEPWVLLSHWLSSTTPQCARTVDEVHDTLLSAYIRFLLPALLFPHSLCLSDSYPSFWSQPAER